MDDSKEVKVGINVGNCSNPIVDQDDDATLIPLLHPPNTTSKVKPIELMLLPKPL